MVAKPSTSLVGRFSSGRLGASGAVGTSGYFSIRKILEELLLDFHEGTSYDFPVLCSKVRISLLPGEEACQCGDCHMYLRCRVTCHIVQDKQQ